MRFDVPTIGPQTVARVRDAGGKAIAIEADKTILVQRDQTLALARKAGITIVAIDDPEFLGNRSGASSDAVGSGNANTTDTNPGSANPRRAA